MNKQLRCGFGMFVCGALLSGCGAVRSETDSVAIVGVDGDQVVYRYSVPSLSFDTPPSSLWVLDTNTAKSRRFLEATRQFSPQIAGDYYVTELVRENWTVGRVVVGEIGTGRRRVIHERPLHPHGSDPFILLAGDSQAAVLIDEGLLVTEVSDPESQRTIALPECARRLIALDNDRVLLTCTPQTSADRDVTTLVMIDLVTEEVTEFPPAPGSSQPFYLAAQVAGSHLVVSRHIAEDDEDITNQILALDLTAGAWRVVADLGPFDSPAGTPNLVFVRGLEGTDVLVERVHVQPLQNVWSLEILDLQSGASRTIVQRTGTIAQIPDGGVLSDGRVIWYEPVLEAVVVRDLSSDETSVFPVRLPK